MQHVNKLTDLASCVLNHEQGGFALPALHLAVMGPQEQENKKAVDRWRKWI
jgi:hypothetical protein